VLSFALTTGGPDCADVYEEKIHPENPLRYEFDGAWRSIEVAEVEIAVKTPDGIRMEPLRIERTHHGPILERKGGRAWAVRTGYDTEIGLIEQWLGMARARNLGEFLNAMRANQSLPQNLMYADVYGNIYYLRAGRVPVRPPGFEWDRPVPGWTSQTEWRGVHPLADLVQILNPPGGFMQNTNVSPGTIMPDSPLTADRYPDVIYNTRTGRSNSRGRRVLELLGSHEKLTLEDARRIAVDTRVDRADRWQEALAQANEAQPARIPYQKLAVDLLLGWDGHMDVDSRAASLFRVWMRMCREVDSGVPMQRIANGEPLDEDGRNALLRALDNAATLMRSQFGRVDVPWGKIHRIRRGDESWPVAGCRADGISTLRSVRFASPDRHGISYARGGQICTTVVVLEERNITSYSATPYGQSNDPTSAHYADQAERLFSRGQLKPTWFRKADLLKHVESKRTLTVPAPEIGSAATEETD
jgi:acyl-homoserine-lactone acylase